MKIILQSFIVLLVVALSIGACSKSTEPAGEGQLTMYMVDAPATNYDAVNVHVQEVAVHSSTRGWVVVNNTPKTYDLLQLVNGAMAVLGDAQLEADHYTQIRLMLGSGNTVVVNGQTYPLVVPSGFETGIKLVQEFRLEAGTRYELLLDFDASRSVVNAGGTSYVLRPTIRVKALALTGSVGGTVSPSNAEALITAIAGTDTVTTYASSSTGAFKVMGLSPATYSIKIQATSGSYRDTTIAGVQVTAGSTTNLGTVVLTAQ